MIGTISDPRIAVRIGEACGAASRAIRERHATSTRREREGQAAIREEAFTEDLVPAIDALGDSLREHLTQESTGSPASGGNVRVEFTTESAPQGEEAAFGLDIGVRVIIETPGYAAEKAILVQCKRMKGSGDSGTFPKLRGDGEDQARKMLAVSPASFFFLFNGGDEEELLELMHLTPAFPYPDRHWFHFWRHEPYFDPGVAVVPAARVLAMSTASQAANGLLPVSARDVLGGSVPLGHFIAGMFAPCFVGDVRAPVIQLATAPAHRGSVGGLDADVPELPPLRAKRFYKLKISKTKLT